jgi:hypothetical protein
MKQLGNGVLFSLLIGALLGCSEESGSADSNGNCTQNGALTDSEADSDANENDSKSDADSTPGKQLSQSDCGPGLYVDTSGHHCVPLVCDITTGKLQENILAPNPKAKEACVSAASEWGAAGTAQLTKDHFEQGTRVLVVDLHYWLGAYCWDCPQSEFITGHCPCKIRMVEVASTGGGPPQ